MGRPERDGVNAALIDEAAEEIVPVRRLVERLLDLTAEDAAALGCASQVAHALTIAACGSSADGQIAAYEKALEKGAGKRKALSRVIDWLAPRDGGLRRVGRRRRQEPRARPPVPTAREGAATGVPAMRVSARVSTAVACLLIAAAGPAAAQSVGEKTGVNSLIGVSPSTQDFVTQAAISDLFEIQTSELALERADEPTKAFARKMIEDHRKISDEMKMILQSGKVQAEVPKALDSSHSPPTRHAQGPERTRLHQAVSRRSGARAQERRGPLQALRRGRRQCELKAFATKNKPHIDEHLKRAQELDKK